MTAFQKPTSGTVQADSLIQFAAFNEGTPLQITVKIPSSTLLNINETERLKYYLASLISDVTGTNPVLTIQMKNVTQDSAIQEASFTDADIGTFQESPVVDAFPGDVIQLTGTIVTEGGGGTAAIIANGYAIMQNVNSNS